MKTDLREITQDTRSRIHDSMKIAIYENENTLSNNKQDYEKRH